MFKLGTGDLTSVRSNHIHCWSFRLIPILLPRVFWIFLEESIFFQVNSTPVRSQVAHLEVLFLTISQNSVFDQLKSVFDRFKFRKSNLIDILQVVIPPTIEDTESSEDQANFKSIGLSYIKHANNSINKYIVWYISSFGHIWQLKYISDLLIYSLIYVIWFSVYNLYGCLILYRIQYDFSID